jgi:hypothetical protein
MTAGSFRILEYALLSKSQDQNAQTSPASATPRTDPNYFGFPNRYLRSLTSLPTTRRQFHDRPAALGKGGRHEAAT